MPNTLPTAGDNFANAFSNHDGSHQSSLGLLVTADTYMGGNGYSLRQDGLEQGFNVRGQDKASWCTAHPTLIQRSPRGKAGGDEVRLPCLRPAVAPQMIDTLKQGQSLFAYYSDPEWLAHPHFQGCPFSAAAKR